MRHGAFIDYSVYQAVNQAVNQAVTGVASCLIHRTHSLIISLAVSVVFPCLPACLYRSRAAATTALRLQLRHLVVRRHHLHHAGRVPPLLLGH